MGPSGEELTCPRRRGDAQGSHTFVAAVGDKHSEVLEVGGQALSELALDAGGRLGELCAAGAGGADEVHARAPRLVLADVLRRERGGHHHRLALTGREGAAIDVPLALP